MDASAWKKHPTPYLDRNNQYMGCGHCSIIEEENLIFFHAWRADEQRIEWYTVYPVSASYHFNGDELVIE